VLAGVGAFLVVVGSFLPFVAYSDERLAVQAGGDSWWPAWATQTFMAPLTWFGILAAIGLLAVTTTRMLRRGQVPTVLSFSAAQLQVVLGLFVSLMFVGYALSTKRYLFGSDAATIGTERVDATLTLREGGYLMVFSAFVALVGALLNLLADHVASEPDVAEPIPVRYSSPPAWAAPDGHRPPPALPPAYLPQRRPTPPPTVNGWTRGPHPSGQVPRQPTRYGMPPPGGR